MSKPVQCLIPSCDRSQETRGLCHKCYHSAWRYVKAGKTTWKELEEQGFAIPSKRSSEGNILGRMIDNGKAQQQKENTKEPTPPIPIPLTPPISNSGQQESQPSTLPSAPFNPGQQDVKAPWPEQQELQRQRDRMTGNKKLMEGSKPYLGNLTGEEQLIAIKKEWDKRMEGVYDDDDDDQDCSSTKAPTGCEPPEVQDSKGLVLHFSGNLSNLGDLSAPQPRVPDPISEPFNTLPEPHWPLRTDPETIKVSTEVIEDFFRKTGCEPPESSEPRPCVSLPKVPEPDPRIMTAIKEGKTQLVEKLIGKKPDSPAEKPEPEPEFEPAPLDSRLELEPTPLDSRKTAPPIVIPDFFRNMPDQHSGQE